MNTEDISHWSADSTVEPPAVHGVAHYLLQPRTSRLATFRLLAATAVLQQIQDSPVVWCLLAPSDGPLGFSSDSGEFSVLTPSLTFLASAITSNLILNLFLQDQVSVGTLGVVVLDLHFTAVF